jgi:hypothetical protein
VLRLERYGLEVARQVGRVRQCVVAVRTYRRRVEGRALHTDRAEHPLLQRCVVSEAHVARSVAPRCDTGRVPSSGDEQVVVDELLPERSCWRNVS